jgi:phage nucleotide-binding protein
MTAVAEHPLRAALKVGRPKQIEFINLMTYGDPGSGKTYLCGTAEDDPRTSPVLLIDVEGGTITVRKRNIDVVQARSLNEVQKIYNTLYKAGEDIYYKTVCVDSFSELQKLDMRFIMKQAKETAKDPDKVDIDVPSMREWGKSLEHMRTMARAFRDLPCNTILTALAHTEKEEGQPDKIFASLSGKARNEIPGFMDIFGYLYTRQQGTTTVRRLQLARTAKVAAKDRTDLLGDSIDNPTIPMIWDIIHGGK